MHCAISLLPDHALIGLVAFGTQVHPYELGFSDLSKIYVFPGTKESRPATLFGCRHHSSPATFPLEDCVFWMAVLFPSSTVSVAAADISFVNIVTIGSRASLPARLLQGRLASLLCRDRLQSQHPDFDRHLLSLHRSSHLLDLARSDVGLLSSVCSTVDLADQVSRKVRELDLKTPMAPPSSNLSSPYPSLARSLPTWVSRSSGWRFPPRLLRLRRPSPWRSPRRSPPSWVHTGKNMKQRK